MDEEEIRILKLARAGREKIIKYGTYDMQAARSVYIPDHPFYVRPESLKASVVEEPVAYAVNDGMGYDDPYAAVSMEPVAPPPPPSDEELTAQILSSNFKSGLSQAEVDALLNGMDI